MYSKVAAEAPARAPYGCDLHRRGTKNAFKTQSIGARFAPRRADDLRKGAGDRPPKHCGDTRDECLLKSKSRAACVIQGMA